MMLNLRNLLPALLLTVLLVSAAYSQTAAGASSSDAALSAASNERQRYIDQFRDLSAPETKTFTLFDKSGSAKKTKTIKSILLVYQLRKRPGIREFRSVVEVDGKPVTGTEQRSKEFLDKVAKAENVESELKKVSEESLRYDDYLIIDNATLFQAVALAGNLRPFFEFMNTGTESVGGILTNVVQYTQSRDTDLISFNGHSRKDAGQLNLDYTIDVDGKNSSPRLEGTMWLDASNGRLVREVRRITVQPEGSGERQIVQETTFDYTPSKFEINTPKRIVFTAFALDKKRGARKTVSVAFDYGEFSQPYTDVRILDED